MAYSIFQVNDDGSASLIGQTQDLDSATALAQSQTTGTYRIELGDSSQSTIMAMVTNE
jgi:hypothetical protein